MKSRLSSHTRQLCVIKYELILNEYSSAKIILNILKIYQVVKFTSSKMTSCGQVHTYLPVIGFILLLPASRSNWSRSLFGDLWDGGNQPLWNVSNYLPNDTVSYSILKFHQHCCENLKSLRTYWLKHIQPHKNETAYN